MASLSQKLYWNAPYSVKCWMASMNARKLDRQRHGKEFDRALQEISEHDKWLPEQFIEYQYQQLRDLIQHAAKNVPYYRKIFAERDIDPCDIKDTKDLARLPILEKQVVRQSPDSLIDETRKGDKLIIAHTSGTTGTALNLSRDLRFNSVAYAFSEARWRTVAGMSRRKNRSVSIGGHLVTAPHRTRPPFWVFNRRWNQLYMSSYHLSSEYLCNYVDELRRFRADYIEGYPSSVYAIAKYIIDNGLEPVPLKACFTTAETLFNYHRDTIKKAFGCRTYNQYGCGEQVVFAAECEDGSMHLSPEVAIVEVVDENDQPVAPGRMGQLICTSLINRVQPFIRYRVGDIGALSDKSCSCRSSLPVLGYIEGRTDAVLITRDGRKIGRLDPVFKGAESIVEAQIVQNDYDKFVIRIVPADDYTDAHGQNIVNNLSYRVGKADIRVEIVDKIERTSSGKFRAVICNLSK